MDASLFLTEVDVHHPKPLIGGHLRSYIVQHSLFFDKLLVGDSQFNNNPNFRQLIWEKEPNPQHVGCPQDLMELSENGFLIPAIRNEYGSLTNLRKDHVARQVATPPSEEYVQLLDDKLGDKVETYNINDVSIAFRERVLEALDLTENVGKGRISSRIALFVKNYVLRQNPLLFDTLRKWMRAQIADGNMTERDYRLVDRLVAGAYRHNVAIALNKNLDIPASASRDIFPISITMGSMEKVIQKSLSNKVDIRPSVVFSQDVLSRVPAKALVEIKRKSPNYSRVITSLETFRTKNQIGMEDFISDLEVYLGEVDMIFYDFLTGKQKSRLQQIRQKETPRAWVKLVADVGLAILSFVPFANAVTNALNSYGLINAFQGGVSDIRSVNRQSDRIKGWIAGRSNSMEKLYEIIK